MIKKYFSLKIIFLSLYFIFLLTDTLIIRRLSDMITLILVVLWVATILVLRLSQSCSLRLSLVCLLAAFITQFFGNMMVLEKSISWFAIFLTIALVHSFLALSGNAKDK